MFLSKDRTPEERAERKAMKQQLFQSRINPLQQQLLKELSSGSGTGTGGWSRQIRRRKEKQALKAYLKTLPMEERKAAKKEYKMPEDTTTPGGEIIPTQGAEEPVYDDTNLTVQPETSYDEEQIEEFYIYEDGSGGWTDSYGNPVDEEGNYL